jgi:hypothetical protein
MENELTYSFLICLHPVHSSASNHRKDEMKVRKYAYGSGFHQASGTLCWPVLIPSMEFLEES